MTGRRKTYAGMAVLLLVLLGVNLALYKSMLARAGPPAGRPESVLPGPIALRQGADFTLPDTGGKTVALKNLLQKGPVLLCFYQNDPVSRLALPLYQRFQSFYGERLQMVGISQEDPATTLRLARQARLTFPQLVEPEPYEISRSYYVRSTPTLVLLASDGSVQGFVESWHAGPANFLSQRVASLTGLSYQPVVTAADGLPENLSGAASKAVPLARR